MNHFRKLALLGAMIAAFGASLVGATVAQAGTANCVVSSGHPCVSSWGYQTYYNMYNNNGGNSIVRCYTTHTDGTWIDSGYIYPHGALTLVGNGYNRAVCYAYSGNEPIGVNIYW